MRHRATRQDKSRSVFGNEKWLDHILCILAGGIAPLRELNVHLAAILARSSVIPGKHAEDNRWLQMRRVSHYKRIGSISEIARERHLRTGPAALTFCDAQVQRAAGVRPR